MACEGERVVNWARLSPGLISTISIRCSTVGIPLFYCVHFSTTENGITIISQSLQFQFPNAYCSLEAEIITIFRNRTEKRPSSLTFISVDHGRLYRLWYLHITEAGDNHHATGIINMLPMKLKAQYIYILQSYAKPFSVFANSVLASKSCTAVPMG